MKVRRAILGYARGRKRSFEQEQNILQAADALIASIKSVLDAKSNLTRRELSLFSRIGITPLLTEISRAFSDDRFADLKIYNRMRLRGHVNNLKSLQTRLEKS